MNEKNGIQVLKYIKEMLDDGCIEYWLDNGTLLGAVRDRRFIPWDSDIDLGVWRKDFGKIASRFKNLDRNLFSLFLIGDIIGIYYKPGRFFININTYDIQEKKALIKYFVNKQIVSYKRRGKRGSIKIRKNLTLTFKYLIWLLEGPLYYGDSPKFVPQIVHNNLIKICRNIPLNWRQKQMKILEKLSLKFHCSNIVMSIPCYFFQNFIRVELYDMEFDAPCPVKAYLEYRYGKDWMIPKKNYIFYEDDQAINND